MIIQKHLRTRRINYASCEYKLYRSVNFKRNLKKNAVLEGRKCIQILSLIYFLMKYII